MPKGVHQNHARSNQQGRWNDGKLVASSGHVKIRIGKDHPLADPNGYAYEHLLVWVSAGRPRPARGQILHHKNEVKSDNRLGNLELLTRAEHNRLHNQGRERSPDGRLLGKKNA